MEGQPHEVYRVHSGALALETAPVLKPDVIMLAADLSDMSGIDACRALHALPEIAHSIPILILLDDTPTPAQRVAALYAGAWDFVRYSGNPGDISLKVQAYVQAKRNIDVALAESPVEPETVVLARSGLAGRAREMGSLMSRMRGSLACIAFAVEGEPVDPTTGAIIARAARISDIVGALRPTEFAVLAPGTGQAGAVMLAQRVRNAMQQGLGGPPAASPIACRVGYEAVDNLAYRPMDPVSMLARASAAVSAGIPEPGHAWLRRFDDRLAASVPNEPRVP